MDWVQIYLIVMISISALLAAYYHGKKNLYETQNFWRWFLSFLLALPYIGRVLGWW